MGRRHDLPRREPGGTGLPGGPPWDRNPAEGRHAGAGDRRAAALPPEGGPRDRHRRRGAAAARRRPEPPRLGRGPERQAACTAGRRGVSRQCGRGARLPGDRPRRRRRRAAVGRRDQRGGPPVRGGRGPAGAGPVDGTHDGSCGPGCRRVPGHVPGGRTGTGAGSRAECPGLHPRALSPVLRTVHPRRLGRDPLRRPLLAGLRPDRGPVRGRRGRDRPRYPAHRPRARVGGGPGPAPGGAGLGRATGRHHVGHHESDAPARPPGLFRVLPARPGRRDGLHPRHRPVGNRPDHGAAEPARGDAHRPGAERPRRVQGPGAGRLAGPARGCARTPA